MLMDDQKTQIGEDAVIAPAPSGWGARLWRARPRRSRLLINLVIVVVTVVFSYIALSGINFSEVWRALRSCDYWWLIPALVAFGLGSVTRAMRWRSLFAPGRRPPPGTSLDATMIGYFYNNIMPARAGEAARVVVLTRRSAAPMVETVGTIVVERLYDVIVVLAIFFVAQPWLPHVSWLRAAAIAAIALALVIASIVAVLVICGDRPLRLLLHPLRRLSLFSGDHLERIVVELAHGLSGLRNRQVAIEASLWTIIAWMLTALCAYLVSLAFHLHLPFPCGVLVAVAVGLSMILPSPPAAIGVFEGAAILALKTYGLLKSTILPYALVLHAVNFVPYVLIGAWFLHYNSRHPPRGGPTNAMSTPSA